jgi:hypothetical protein
MKLGLYDDPDRWMGLTDLDNLGSTVALGAAAESLVLAAHAEELEVRVEEPTASDPEPRPVVLDLAPTTTDVEPHDFDHLEMEIEHRATDRRKGARTPLPPEAREALRHAAGSVEGVELRLLTERADIDAMAALIGKGDRLRILDPALSEEMFSELRWSPAEAQATGDGLDLASLALSATDRAGLELARKPEALALLAEWGLGDALAKLGRETAEASSALGLITVKPADRAGYFRAGRAVQRVWLTASAQKLALHPLSFLPYAFARLLRGGGQGLAPSTARGLAELRAPYARLLKLDGSEGEVLLFRVFPSLGAVPRSVRRPVDAVLWVDPTEAR